MPSVTSAVSSSPVSITMVRGRSAPGSIFSISPAASSDKVGGLFEGAAEAVAERGHRRGCLLCNSAVEVAPHDREVEARVVLHLGALRDAFERALLAEAGRYSAGEAARLADLLTANYMGLLVLAKAGFSLVHLRRVAAGAAALLEAADTGGIEKPGLSYHIQGLCHAAAERTIVGADGRSVMTDSNTLALTKSAAAGVAMLALVGCASTGGSDTYSEEELSRLGELQGRAGRSAPRRSSSIPRRPAWSAAAWARPAAG